MKAVAVGAAVPLVAAAALTVLADRDGATTAVPSPQADPAGVVAGERQAFLTYEQAIEAAVQDGGFAVTQGMQPGVADIAEGAFPDETLVTMASGWVATMERVRGDLAAVDPPEFLTDTAGLYDEALAAYVEVAETLLAAAEADGEQRVALVEEVPALGERADDLWDAAEAELNRHRIRLGLDEATETPPAPAGS